MKDWNIKIAAVITTAVILGLGFLYDNESRPRVQIRCEVCGTPMEKTGDYAVYQPQQYLTDGALPIQKVALYWICPKHPRMKALICVEDKTGKNRVYNTKLIEKQSNIEFRKFSISDTGRKEAPCRK